MNRILFEPAEVAQGIAEFGGARAAHVLGVLHGEVGQRLKVGVVDGGIGTGEITAIGDGKVKVAFTLDGPGPRPWFDLVLAPPRPRVFKRILPQLATLGLRRLYLVGAQKVEKDFWGATILKEENYRPLLVEGLMQAGTAMLPTIACERNFRKFLATAQFEDGLKLVAHPYGAGPLPPETKGFVTFAVGPEGGWTEAEVEALEAHGFARGSLGSRILRSDTALIALISRFLP